MFKDTNQILPKRYVGIMNYSFKTWYGINLEQGLDHELEWLIPKKLKIITKQNCFDKSSIKKSQ